MDSELVDDLKNLPSDPALWLYPPQHNACAIWFRNQAILWFRGDHTPEVFDPRYIDNPPDPMINSQDLFEKSKLSFSSSDPLILDLNGDGVKISTLTDSKVLFDIDGDGFAERTEWASANDGMLAIDTNGNGAIDNIAELFGDNTAANGIAKLKVYDLNGDNVIDANDAVYSQLKIWQDANQNGITDSGELKSLAEWNISSIGLTPPMGRSASPTPTAPRA